MYFYYTHRMVESMSQNTMRSLKVRDDKIQCFVDEVYFHVTMKAKNQGNTRYEHPICEAEELVGLKRRVSELPRYIHKTRGTLELLDSQLSQMKGNFGFRMANLDEILRRLRSLFPSISVNCKMMVTGLLGTLSDISTIDEAFQPSLMHHAKPYIVVDWS